MRALLTLLVACGGADSTPPADSAATDVDDSDRTVTLAAPAQGYQVTTPPFEVPAYTEVQVCSIVRMEPHGDEPIAWLTAMESLSSPGTHHMNVFIGQFSFLDAFLGDGASQTALGTTATQLPCEDLGLMSQAFPIFPSQRESQRITLPPGVAAPLPLPLVAVFSHHFVNASDGAITINAALNLESMPREEVAHVGSLIFDDIRGLDIAPGTRQSYARTCVTERDVDVALVSTHNHEWATCATIHAYDGDAGTVEDTPLYVNTSWDQPPILHFEPGTYALAAGDGLHWACHYDNPSDRTIVNDGSASGEMCVLAAVAWPAPFSAQEVEEIVQTRDLGQLTTLLGQVMGPCDQVVEDGPTPWETDAVPLGGPPPCDGLQQTE
jgi:hypothetical protein